MHAHDDTYRVSAVNNAAVNRASRRSSVVEIGEFTKLSTSTLATNFGLELRPSFDSTQAFPDLCLVLRLRFGGELVRLCNVRQIRWCSGDLIIMRWLWYLVVVCSLKDCVSDHPLMVLRLLCRGHLRYGPVSPPPQAEGCESSDRVAPGSKKSCLCMVEYLQTRCSS